MSSAVTASSKCFANRCLIRYVFLHEFTCAKVRQKIRNPDRRIADRFTKIADSLLLSLLSIELRGRLPRHLFEQTGEMIGIFKAELV